MGNGETQGTLKEEEGREASNLTTEGRNQAEGELGEAKSRESGEVTQFRDSGKARGRESGRAGE